LVTATAVVITTMTFALFADSAGACSYSPVAKATFEGKINRIDPRGGTATFTIDHVESTEQAKQFLNRPPEPPVSMPADADEIAVRYPPPQVVELREGESYRVEAAARPGADSYWSSTAVDHIATNEMCDYEDVPARTTLVDGSAVENSAKTMGRRIAATDPRMKLAFGSVVVVGAGVVLFAWRRRRHSLSNST